MREQATYFAAPDALRDKIMADPARRQAKPRPRLLWFNASVAFALLVIVIWSVYANLPWRVQMIAWPRKWFPVMCAH